MKIFQYVLFGLLSSSFTFVNSQSTANYSITFTSVWNAADHGTLPSGPHWSKLIGGNHANINEFWQVDALASLGIENVSEIGNNDVFQEEVETSILANNTQQLILMSSVGSATGSVTINNLNVDQSFPLLSLVSMIAPSPDWFIGINSFNLRQNEEWITNAIIDLFAYDAGTENGDQYSTDNNSTIPQENISSLINVFPFNDQKIGYFTIILNSILDVDELLTDKSLKIYPNPSRTFVTFSNLEENNVVKIEIFDIIGKLVKEILVNDNKIIVSLSELKGGIYLVKTSSKNGKNNSVKRLILEK